MTELIKDLKILEEPAEPLEFLTEKGIDRTEGDEIIKQLKEILEANTAMTAIAAPETPGMAAPVPIPIPAKKRFKNFIRIKYYNI